MNWTRIVTTKSDRGATKRAPRARWTIRALALTLIALAAVSSGLAGTPALAEDPSPGIGAGSGAEAAAAEAAAEAAAAEAAAAEAAGEPTPMAVEAPQVFSLLAQVDRMNQATDMLRATFVLRVPAGYIKSNGDINKVDKRTLRVGYDFTGDRAVGRTGLRGLDYINTFSRFGAGQWAQNNKPAFTVHKMIHAGVNDYLVMSAVGDMGIANGPENNVPGGEVSVGNLYFGLDDTNPADSTPQTAWIDLAQTVSVYPITFRAYSSTHGAEYVSGPIIGLPTGKTDLWRPGYTNWAQVIDYSLDRRPPEHYHANSISVDLANPAFQSAVEGPAGSVSSSFWYAWVHENGTLVTEINTAPIHVTGVTPHEGIPGKAGTQVKNVAVSAGKPTLAYTPEAAAQGLTQRVSTDGEIDFTNAGGTGFYRMMVWPESENPAKVTVDNGAPQLSYSRDDLFTGSTPNAGVLEAGWTVSSVFLKYDIPRPAPPVITKPQDGERNNSKTSVLIQGTGLPGHSITLKFRPGGPIADIDDPALTTIAQGERACTPIACKVMVQADGTWSFTYTPPAPLADGHYSVVAQQTEQETIFQVTSRPSNPDDPKDPLAWGVGFDIDTVEPGAPGLECPASPTSERRPTLSGNGVEEGATVNVYLGGTLLGTATVAGETWTFTPDQDLPAGASAFTVTQQDQAGNESPQSARACTIDVIASVIVTGTKVVAPVLRHESALGLAEPESWEIVARSENAERVISGGAKIELERGEEVILAERVAGEGAAAEAAALYAPKGTPICVDADGIELPTSNFDPATGKLRFMQEDAVTDPIACTITNQASEATLVTKRLGGQTAVPVAGWSVAATPIDGAAALTAPAAGPSAVGAAAVGVAGAVQGIPFELDERASSAVVHPGKYRFAIAVPSGESLVGVERLDQARAECAANAIDPIAAPESCWLQAAATGVPIKQGEHEVLRAVSATPGDLPQLPFTGGLGSWIFTLGGVALFVVAAGVLLLQRRAQGEA